MISASLCNFIHLTDNLLVIPVALPFVYFPLCYPLHSESRARQSQISTVVGEGDEKKTKLRSRPRSKHKIFFFSLESTRARLSGYEFSNMLMTKIAQHIFVLKTHLFMVKRAACGGIEKSRMKSQRGRRFETAGDCLRQEKLDAKVFATEASWKIDEKSDETKEKFNSIQHSPVSPMIIYLNR